MGPWASSIPAHTTPIATKLSQHFPNRFLVAPPRRTSRPWADRLPDVKAAMLVEELRKNKVFRELMIC
jgi:hypothetical protein